MTRSKKRDLVPHKDPEPEVDLQQIAALSDGLTDAHEEDILLLSGMTRDDWRLWIDEVNQHLSRNV